MALTDRTCNQTPTGKDQWIADSGRRGAGRLYLRITKGGRRLFYFRYVSSDGDRVNIPIGEYSQKAGTKGRVTLKDAQAKADEYSRLYVGGVKDIREHLERERINDAEQHERNIKARVDADAAAKRGSLKNLLNAYVDSLKKRGKLDARDVENLFKNHVFKHADLCATKASDVKPAALRPVLAEIIDAGKGRTAAKVRSYIRAAYAAAIHAENDPSAPASLLGFSIEQNPADVLSNLKQFSKAGNRTLSEAELRAYMLGVDKVGNSTVRDALRMALLLGGQRPTQLLRVGPVDVDIEAETISLLDSKGARDKPRVHVLPLVGEAKRIAKLRLEENREKSHLFANTKDKPIYRELLAEEVGSISKQMLADKVSRGPFRQGDIRRTCETMMAAMGISKDMRGQIQSHGLSGVQAKHYDRHDYAKEKRAVLTAWAKKLDAIRNSEEDGNVVPIRSTTAA